MKAKNFFKFSIFAFSIFASSVFADDFDDWGSFGSDDGGDFSGGFSSSSSIDFSGEGELQSRLYLDTDADKAQDFPVEASAFAKLGANYSGSNVDAEIVLKFEKDLIENYPQDVIDEFTLRGYFGNFKLEAGKMKVVWGKGDKLHVLDNFNADDYRFFIVPDYIDRRISTPMFRAIYSTASSLRFEGIWAPYTDTTRFATSGIWTPESYTTLKNLVTGVVTSWAANENGGLIKAAQFDSDDIYPDTKKLKYGQAGLRVTGTAGSLDWGASYYYGRYKEPSVNLSSYIANQSALPVLDYDWKQTFGLEAATVLWRFNLRGEAAYNLTADTKGDDPWVHNNSVAWLFGFDIDIPVSNININVQETGTYILQNSKVDDGEGFSALGKIYQSALKKYDVDYDEAGYTNNKLVVNISDSLLNDKIVPEVLLLWGIERGDLVVKPKISYKPNGNLTLFLSGFYIHCKNEDSEFYGWRNNSFVNAGVNCKF
jgi:hypothetical protein